MTKRKVVSRVSRLEHYLGEVLWLLREWQGGAEVSERDVRDLADLIHDLLYGENGPQALQNDRGALSGF